MAIIIQTADLTPNSLSAREAEWVYNGLDCCVTLEVLNELLPQLDNVSRNTYEFSKALQAPVLDMTMFGLRVDQVQRTKVLDTFRARKFKYEAQLDRLCKEGLGQDINWRSVPDLRHLFYTVLNLPVVRKRNSQGRFAPTVDRDAIEKLSSYFFAEPFCTHLLALRDLGKKISFLETGIDPDGRIRCNFNIAGTNTGRLASSMSDYGTGTNLQNVDRELRSVCVSDPGQKFANLDLEQGDARNVGAVCWNTFVNSHGEGFAGSYLEACESGDLHTSVCKMAWRELGWGTSVDPSADRRVAEALAYRQDSYRQLAKKLGHGTNYYGTPKTMAKHVKVDVQIIHEFQERYFDAFEVIGTYDKTDHKSDNWHNHVRAALRSAGFLTTLLGRRRYFFGHPKDDETLRAAIAYEPQSMTADEIDQGLLNIWRANRVQCLLQVHDSILIQYPEEQEDEIIPWALDQLRTTITLAKGRDFTVPTEAKVGWNWGEVVYWTADDAKHGLCSQEQIGSVKENADGLVKWKEGGDKRKRQIPVRDKLSLLNL